MMLENALNRMRIKKNAEAIAGNIEDEIDKYNNYYLCKNSKKEELKKLCETAIYVQNIFGHIAENLIEEIDK